MKSDLKPFYETTHNLLFNLEKSESVRFNQIYKSDLLHQSQFQTLITILNRFEIIETRVLLPQEKNIIIASAATKGNKFEEFKNWLPNDSSELNPSRNEYYLLYLEYHKNNIQNYPFSFKPKSNSATVYFVPNILSKSELFLFFLKLKKSERKIIDIGNQKFPPVFPKRLIVYDLTKLGKYTVQYTREGFQSIVNNYLLKYKEIDDLILNEFGNNVTLKLGFNGDEIQLPYFETYYRLTNLFPEFEEKLLDELKFPTEVESLELNKNTFSIKQENASDSETSIGTEDSSNISEEQLPAITTTFKYALFYPTIKDDLVNPCFNVETIASVFAEHISNMKNESGQMIGIFGKWGRGKTYFKKEVEKILRDKDREKDYEIIDFCAWKYQDTPAIWAYLYECLTERYFYSGFFYKYWKKFWLNFKRESASIIKGFLFIVAMWSLVALTFSLVDSNNSTLINIVSGNWWQTIAGGTLFTSFLKFSKKGGTKAKDLLKKYTKGISFNQHLGVQAEIDL